MRQDTASARVPATHESRGRGLSRTSRFGIGATATVATLVATGAFVWAGQLPTGGSVASGNVTFSQPNATTLNITQTTQSAIINWNSFSIGKGETVNFIQPGASSSTLNRVTGSLPSWIAGFLNASGTIILINPNGITITKNAVINTGSFAASTVNIKDTDFLSGHYTFMGNGASAAVINNGHIKVSDGGFAALLGGQVNNRGVIAAKLGKVALGAGELITLDLAGDGFLSVAVPSSQLGNLVSANGALVSNKGKIAANGGTVYLSAATASTILRDAVNIPGSIRVNTVGTHNGRIVLNGGPGGHISVGGTLLANGGRKHKGGSIAVAGQSVDIKGKLAASGAVGGDISVASTGALSFSGKASVKGGKAKGGTIDLTGADVTVLGALIDVSGATGGGLVRIGGTFQGGKGDPNSSLFKSFMSRFGARPQIASAQTVTIDAGTHINVSATRVGDGGTAIVWSQQQTNFAGTITGVGGPQGGNGGFAEVSSHGLLNDTGLANLKAPQGNAGTLLLDPWNVVISNGADSNISCNPNCIPSGTSVLNVTTLQNQLANSDVIVTTGNGGTDAGDITVLSPLTWGASNTTLILSADRNVNIFANVTDTGFGVFNVQYAQTNSAGTFNIAQGASVSFTQSGPNLFALKQGSDATTYTVFNTYSDLASSVQNDAFTPVALGADLDMTLSGTQSPLGTLQANFEGLGHTIKGLFINDTNVNHAAVGLFNSVSSGVGVRDLHLVNAAIAGTGFVGGIAGENFGTIAGVTVNGLFQSSSSVADVGGIAGRNENQSNVVATISQSSSSGTVTAVGGGAPDVGGLVGFNNTGAVIDQSFSSARVTAPANGGSVGAAGGLVGVNQGIVTSSYATGPATATGGVGGFAGGLVGANFSGGIISQSFATGTATGTLAGGLVGDNDGKVMQSYWDTSTSGTFFGLRGGQTTSGASADATGLTTAQLQAMPQVGWNTLTTWALQTNKSYPYLQWQALGGTPVVMSGTVSNGNTPVASAAFTTLVNSSYAASGTSGANGYYYELFAPLQVNASTPGQVLTYLTGANSGATYQQNVTASATGINIAAGVLTLGSASTTLSSVTGGLTTAIGGDAGATTAVSTLSSQVVNASAAAFTVDGLSTSKQNVTLNGAGSVTVSSAVTDSAGGGILTVNAATSIAVNASVSYANGAVVLRADSAGANNGGTVTFGGGAKVTAHNSASILYNPANYTAPTSFAGVAGDGSTTVTAYMLVNNLAQLQTVGTNLSGTYALGKDIDASTAGNFQPIGSGSLFTGVFDGQGHVISNLTINQPNATTPVGLFGFLGSSGIVRSVGLVNVNITGRTTNDITVPVGALAGQTLTGALVSNAYATGSVTGASYVGGLIGFNSGSVTNSYTNVAVSETAQSQGTPAGGLVGYSNGSISQSFATGPVSGFNSAILGGLAGEVDNGSVADGYATGSVTLNVVNGGDPNATAAVGGLVGVLAHGATIARSYSIGLVTAAAGQNANVGGFIGSTLATAAGHLTDSYWNTQTSGQLTGIGFVDTILGSSPGNPTANTTTQLQAALHANYSASTWGIIAGQSYPYLKAIFLTTPQVVSGTVFSDRGVTPITSGTTYALVNGATTSASVGADGSYYYLFPANTLNGLTPFLVAGGSGGNYLQSASGSQTGLAIYGGTLRETGSADSLSGLNTTVASFAAGNVAVLAPLNAATTELDVTTTNSSFTVDVPVNLQRLVISAPGTVTQTAAISVTELAMLGGGKYTFTNTSNQFSTIAGSVSGLSLLNNNGALTIGTVAGQAGLNAGGGAVTLEVWNGDILFAGGATINNNGATTFYYDPSGGFANPTSFSGKVSVTPTTWMLINDVNQLGAINQNLSARYALAHDIGNSFWLTSIGGTFTGTLDGRGHTVSNLTMSRPLINVIGGSGTVENLTLTGQIPSILNGSTNVEGPIAATNSGAVANVWTNVFDQASSWNNIGGLVGTNTGTGTITNSHVLGNLEPQNSGQYAGGLVGVNFGSITQSSVSGHVFVAVLGTPEASASGGFVGINLGTITGSYASGAVIGQVQSGQAPTGGFVGENGGTITGSYATGNTTGAGYTGGFVGYNDVAATVTTSFAAGAVNRTAAVGGGFVGYNNGLIDQSYSIGVANAPSVFGFAGQNGGVDNMHNSQFNQFGMVISNSYFNTTTSQQTVGVDPNNHFGTTQIGSVNSSNAYSAASYSGFQYGPNAWQLLEEGRIMPLPAAASNTSITDPITLQLAAIHANKSFTLTTNLDFSDAALGNIANIWKFDSGLGRRLFIGIGSPFNQDAYFTGVFDGGGHTISNLSLNTALFPIAASYGSLFSINGGVNGGAPAPDNPKSGAIIKNLTLVNPVGLQAALVGQYLFPGLNGSAATAGDAPLSPAGSISNVTVNNATVNNIESSGITSVGGLIGYDAGADLSNVIVSGTIANHCTTCSAMAVGGLVGSLEGRTVSAAISVANVGVDVGNHTLGTGGLVGRSDFGLVTESFTTSPVNSVNGIGIGGLVGYNTGIIYNAYAATSGTVGGSNANDIGGLVGFNDGFGYIVNAYSTGQPTVDFSGRQIGGLVGLNTATTTIVSSYWDTSTSLTNTSAAGTGRTTAQLQDLAAFQANYSGWDFHNVWSPPNQNNQGGITPAHYPELYSLSHVIWVDPSSITAVYGSATTPSFTTSIYGLHPSDDTSIITGLVLTNITNNGSVGVHTAVTACCGSATSRDGTAYRFVYTNGTETITPKSITLTGGLVSRAYFDPNPATTNQFTAPGLVSGDVIASVSVNNGPAQSAAVGSYTWTPGNATFSSGSASNYLITYVNGTFNITTRAITITGGALTRTYGDPNQATTNQFSITSGSLANGNTIDLVSVTNGPAVTANVGNYPWTPAAAHFTNGSASNYQITYANGTIGVTQRTLNGSASVTGVDKTYDSTTAAVGGSVGLTVANNVVNGDIVNYSFTSGTYDSANAGPRVVSSPVGAAISNGNYSLGTLTVTISGTINQRPLSGNASITGIDKTYDGTAATTVGSSVGLTAANNVVSGDTVNYSFASGSYDSANAGPRTVGSLAGVALDNGNYTLGTLSVGVFGTINPRPLTGVANITGIDKTYDATAAAGPGHLILLSGFNNVVNGDTVTTSVTGGTYDSPNAGLHIVNALTGLGQNNPNYTLGTLVVTASGNIARAPLTLTATTNTKTYDSTSTAAALPTVSGLQGSDTVTALSETYADKNFGTGKTLNVATYTVNDGNGGANYTVQTVADLTGVINKATLTYVADPATRLTGAPNPVFTGKVTGFVGTETQIDVTTGTLQFTSTADALSAPGQYAITGSGLNAFNYTFVQAPNNATALTITVPPPPPNQQPPTNQFPHTNVADTPTHDVNITFQNNNVTLTPASFTPSSTNVVTRTLTDSTGAGNNGFDYQPISQYDPNQYSQFQLPGYQADASEAAIFTIIARAVSPDNKSDFLIDSFWTGTGGDWKGANGNNPLNGKVTFSDGAGHEVTPTDGNAFPIDAGKTDFAQLLKTGPVMLGGAPGQKPSEWLLATGMAPDGKGIICADPITGKLVELSYDATTNKVGGVTGFFDPKTKGVASLADASGNVPAGAGAGALSTLQGFVPSTFFAVTVSK